MSKIKFGALLVDMRGKQGGTIYSRNKSGAYSKNKVTPINPRTSFQQAQRNALSARAQAWRSLTADKRQGWIQGSANFPQKDVFGDQYFLAGNMLYNKLNLNLEKVGLTPISSCPTPLGTDQATVSNPVFSALALEVDLVTIPAGYSAIISATPGMSAGRYNYNSKLRNIAILDAGAGGGAYDFVAEYTAKFGVPIVGQKIGMSFELINKTTGEAGVAVNIDAVVA